MINILSLNCGLAFAPYIAESVSAFLTHGPPISRAIRQGGSGFTVRSGDRLALRHQNREAELHREEAKHYLATIKLRIDLFEIERMSDEVVLANFDGNLFLSHPQSDLWLDRSAVEYLVAAGSQSTPGDHAGALPDWLTVSTGAGRLLISDQRNGRWVLLGSDHIAELERRLACLKTETQRQAAAKPPVILLKGVTIHLQSARRLLKTVQEFATSGEVTAFEELAPHFSLQVRKSTEGIEISDSAVRIGITAREARKWAAIIDQEMSRLNVIERERGLIRTVFADAERGRWVLQWGDEVFVSADCMADLLRPEFQPVPEQNDQLAIGKVDGFLVLLSPRDSACVALTSPETGELLSTGTR